MPKRSATSFVELKFRVRAPLHAKLMAATKRNDVSLAAEATKRLERSFEMAAVEVALETYLKSAEDRLGRILGQIEQRTAEIAALDETMTKTFRRLQRGADEIIAEATHAERIVIGNEGEREGLSLVADRAEEVKHAR